MKITFCKKAVLRLGSRLDVLRGALVQRGHEYDEVDCLDRCTSCDRGALVARADGMPTGADTLEQFIRELDGST